MFELRESSEINIWWNNTDFSITAFNASWLFATSLSHCCWVTLCLSWHTNSSSSAFFDGLWPSIFLWITSRGFQWGSNCSMTGSWSGLPPFTPELSWGWVYPAGQCSIPHSQVNPDVIQRNMNGHKPSHKAELLEFLCQEWLNKWPNSNVKGGAEQPRRMNAVIEIWVIPPIIDSWALPMLKH